jgi:hypothetical protein
MEQTGYRFLEIPSMKYEMLRIAGLGHKTYKPKRDKCVTKENCLE